MPGVDGFRVGLCRPLLTQMSELVAPELLSPADGLSRGSLAIGLHHFNSSSDRDHRTLSRPRWPLHVSESAEGWLQSGLARDSSMTDLRRSRCSTLSRGTSPKRFSRDRPRGCLQHLNILTKPTLEAVVGQFNISYWASPPRSVTRQLPVEMPRITTETALACTCPPTRGVHRDIKPENIAL
jgi:hypothetical protein